MWVYVCLLCLQSAPTLKLFLGLRIGSLNLVSLCLGGLFYTHPIRLAAPLGCTLCVPVVTTLPSGCDNQECYQPNDLGNRDSLPAEK